MIDFISKFFVLVLQSCGLTMFYYFEQKYLLAKDERILEITDLLPQTTYTIRIHGNITEGELTFKTQAGALNCSTGTTIVISFH